MKQTVMTSVYGVTYIGARDQIKKRLKERGAIADDSELFAASCYAAKVRKLYFSVCFMRVQVCLYNVVYTHDFCAHTDHIDCLGRDV